MLKAVGYTRVSTEEQSREGVSLEMQATKIRQYAELNDLNLSEIVTDAGISGKDVKHRAKADPADALQVGAPMPGMVASIAVSVGHKVKEGDNLLVLEAMKMFASVTAPCDGTVHEIAAKVGESVASKDLLIRLTK